MIKKGTCNVFFYLSFLMTMFFIYPTLEAQEHKKIVEKIVVENIEIPVRVFAGNQPVTGLKKEDFQLLVNGKKTKINGFYEVKKKLADQFSRDSGSPATRYNTRDRLFLLIFNLSSFNQDITSRLDIFFERIIRPNDRLMVLTNRFFISEWEVANKEEAKRKILQVLEKEIQQLKMQLLEFETDLRANAATLKSRLNNTDGNAISAFQDFFSTYLFILEDIKAQYLDIPVDQYIKIAEYLKSQEADKWVINFYQLGRLPMPDSLGEISRIINRYLDDSSPQGIRVALNKLYYDLFIKVKMIDTLFIDDIAKAFINSGATVHTQLLIPLHRAFSEDFKYETISTPSESILKEMSHLTGGSILTSNRTETFVKDITTKEDILYILTYAPKTGKKQKKPKLSITINKKNYRVSYDNQQRLKSFNDMLARLTQNDEEIEIQSLSCNNRLLTFVLKNIQVVQYEEEKFWAVQARIKVFDQKSHLVTNFEKVFKGKDIEGEGTIRIKLPLLDKGNYYAVLEVKDLFSLQSVVAGDAISFTTD